MLITGPEGFSPIQKKTAPPAAFPGPGRRQVQDGYYDQYTASAPAAQSGSSFDQITLSAQAGQEASPTFRSLAASLSQQVRTHNTTGKIQELRQEVRSGQYQISPRETAARMLLLEAEE